MSSSRRSRGMVSMKPPAIVPNAHIRQTLRFVNTAGNSNLPVSATGILGALGVVCSVTNTSGVLIAGSFKLHRIRVWAPANPVSANPGSTISIQWTSTGAVAVNQTDLMQSDSSINPSYPPFLDVKPPPGTQAKFWNQNTGNVMFVVASPQYSIIDVSLEYVLTDNSPINTTTLTVGVLNSLYYLALDGRTSNTLIPQSLPTTA